MVFLILVVQPALDSTDSLMEGASYAAMALTLGLLGQLNTPILWVPLMQLDTTSQDIMSVVATPQKKLLIQLHREESV